MRLLGVVNIQHTKLFVSRDWHVEHVGISGSIIILVCSCGLGEYEMATAPIGRMLDWGESVSDGRKTRRREKRRVVRSKRRTGKAKNLPGDGKPPKYNYIYPTWDEDK